MCPPLIPPSRSPSNTSSLWVRDDSSISSHARYFLHSSSNPLEQPIIGGLSFRSLAKPGHGIGRNSNISKEKEKASKDVVIGFQQTIHGVHRALLEPIGHPK